MRHAAAMLAVLILLCALPKRAYAEELVDRAEAGCDKTVGRRQILREDVYFKTAFVSDDRILLAEQIVFDCYRLIHNPRPHFLR